MIMKKLAGILLVAAAATAVPALAQAQQDSPPGDFDPIGLRRGVFLIYPRVEAGIALDSNIFANDDAEEDIVLTVAPSVRAESQWSRHELNVEVTSLAAAYVDNNDSNFVDFGGEVSGRFDIRRDRFVQGGLGLGLVTEPRDSPDDTDNNEPNQLYRGDLDLAYRQNFNRIFIQPGVRITRLDFINNDQDRRDRYRYTGRLRAGYAISPRLRGFGQGDLFAVRFDDTPVIDRDSVGGSLRGGVEVGLTDFVTGEVALGVTYETFDDDALDDVFGPSAEGALTYTVTPLTTLIGTIDAGVESTTVTFDGDVASSDLETAIGLEARHELRRNIFLSAELGYARNDFVGTDRTDDSYLAGVGATYFLSRTLSVEGSLRYETRSSDDGDAEYDRNVIFVGLNAQL